MDNPFENPFEDLDTKWRLPEGETPHVETIRLLRTLGGSNEITNKELTQLAYFLNEHRDARHAWPGERLFHLLVGINICHQRFDDIITIVDHGVIEFTFYGICNIVFLFKDIVEFHFRNFCSYNIKNIRGDLILRIV